MDLIGQIDSAVAQAEALQKKVQESSCSMAPQVDQNEANTIAKLRAQRANVLTQLASSGSTSAANAFFAYVCNGFQKGL